MTKEFIKDGRVIATLTDGILTVEEGVEEISEGIFSGNCEIKKAVIDVFGCRIKANAFFGCEELESLKVSVMSIEERAFYGCPKLSSAYIHTMYGEAKNIFENPENVIRIGASVPSFYYVFDPEAKGDYLEVKYFGRFSRKICSFKEYEEMKLVANEWCVHKKEKDTTDRCGSDYEFCYDGISETTYGLFPEDLLFKNGELIGVTCQNVVIFLNHPSTAKPYSFNGGKYSSLTRDVSYLLKKK